MSATSVWELIKQTAVSWDRINAPRLGAALAFYTLLSIAPLLVVCIGIAGLILAQAAEDQIAYQHSGSSWTRRQRALQSVLQNADQACRELRRHRGRLYHAALRRLGRFRRVPRFAERGMGRQIDIAAQGSIGIDQVPILLVCDGARRSVFSCSFRWC